MSPQDINNPLSNKAKQSSRTAEIDTRVTQLWAQSQFRVLALRLWSFHFDDREATFGQNGVVLCLLIWCVQSRGLFFFLIFIWALCPRTAALKPRDAVSWCCESDKRIPAETPRGTGETLKMKQAHTHTHTQTDS